MFTKAVNQNQKSSSAKQTNTIESLKDFGSSITKNTASTFKQMGSGIFNQFIGANRDSSQGDQYDKMQDFEGQFGEKFSFPEKKQALPQRKEFTVFNYQDYYESRIIKDQIKQLTEAVRKEIEMVKRADQALLNDINDIQKLTVEALPNKPGVYHIRFLEIILSLLRTIRAKIGESRTWMQALISKKKKRGSLFVIQSKKKGTQYSLSQELQTARSVQ